MSSTIGGVVARIEDVADSTKRVIQSPKTHRSAIRLVIFLLLSTLLFFLAVIAYWAFYWLYVPEISLTKPVYLHYEIDKPPTAFVELNPRGRYLAFDQVYTVDIDLLVPSSERNMEIGNFMVTLELRTADNVTLLSTSRPGIVKYESKLYRTISTLFRVFPLLFDWRQEQQRLRITLAESFRQPSRKRAVAAIITINRPELQVYAVNLHFHARLEGLRYWMFYHPALTFAAFTILFVFWEIVFSFATWTYTSGLAGVSEGKASFQAGKLLRDDDFSEDEEDDEEGKNIRDESDDGWEEIDGRRQRKSTSVLPSASDLAQQSGKDKPPSYKTSVTPSSVLTPSTSSLASESQTSQGSDTEGGGDQDGLETDPRSQLRPRQEESEGYSTAKQTTPRLERRPSRKQNAD